MLLTQSTAHFPSSALVVSGLSSQINLAIVFRTKSTCKPPLKYVTTSWKIGKGDLRKTAGATNAVSSQNLIENCQKQTSSV